jgi:hypothetical protein
LSTPITTALSVCPVAWTCIAVLALSIALSMYTPGEGVEWAVVAGVLTTLAIGEVVIRFAENHKKH